MTIFADNDKLETWHYGGDDDVRLSRAKRVVALFALCISTGLLWAYFAILDEVSTGSGRVVPIRKEQVVQSLEGGILSILHVRENQIVEAGQILAQLDPTMTESDVGESAAKYRAALASASRLTAEVNQQPLTFPEELAAYSDLITSETQLFEARKRNLTETLSWIDESAALVREELAVNQGLSKIGAASAVEIIRLKRELAELELKKVETSTQYVVSAREELAKANAEVASLRSVISGQADSLARMTLRSPVRGIVKNIEVSTIGGVVPPNGKLMDIIPLGDQLLIEARISPRDIAFIHPGQRATVKITAYDYSIYGALQGKVTTISPDTIQDEIDPEIYYYRVFVETESDALLNQAGQRFPIAPGMIATVDIHTGEKSVLDYLIKPFNKAREAMRER
ncbi:HlyD family type I secretion periplasmic adaptor subunit [Rhizobium sp. LC145]|jgi:membrane fusion protein, adhesin transport system|uniref:HlyD family type I secretion periplasmic adaptor subunit n=1 Tax=Rhizobium sp. LC145 TaxID=1120688 RepID=UPI00062A253D|nr:HlyD family type I secretion periplasmic adaptor subunit [Rhizobium sp. LC145]KKX33016.1 secretion protein HlyD [Rhizobium sp. LC145]TKT55953.1 HlyD family type I secretion periplasmic adaptor subunit [Rhizobiaceae bacterium LC148]